MLNTIGKMFKSPHFWKVWLPPHLIAVIGLFYAGLTASTLAIAFTFYCLISGLGIAVGFHRYFSHRAFKTSSFWQQAMLYFGCLACHGHPFFWVALHRGLHHRYADTVKDPHSPTHGLWTAYQGYAFDPALAANVPLRAGADFLRHPSWQWSINHYHKVLWVTWIFASLLSPSLLIGLALAQVWAIHQEALVNVLGHFKPFGGYRNFDTPDLSVNRNLLSLFTWGQSLHNNHHHHASTPSFAVHSWELDPAMIWINIIRAREDEDHT